MCLGLIPSRNIIVTEEVMFRALGDRFCNEVVLFGHLTSLQKEWFCKGVVCIIWNWSALMLGVLTILLSLLSISGLLRSEINLMEKRAVFGLTFVVGAIHIARYKLLQKDWFAYNPMRLNIGSIARWQGEVAPRGV